MQQPDLPELLIVLWYHIARIIFLIVNYPNKFYVLLILLHVIVISAGTQFDPNLYFV